MEVVEHLARAVLADKEVFLALQVDSTVAASLPTIPVAQVVQESLSSRWEDKAGPQGVVE